MLKQNISADIDTARELIVSNRVLVNGALQNNVNAQFDVSVQISLTKEDKKYVSRGGYKLEAALGAFNIDVNNLKGLDVGASTGGFTDCLLQRGAKQVISIDVGRSQLDEKIRKNTDVKIFERLNAKDLNLEITQGQCDLCVIDVSFTSILPLLPAIFSVLAKDAPIIALIKPQFEGEKSEVKDDGVIEDSSIHKNILKRFIKEFPEKYYLDALKSSPITGAKGNIEFLGLFKASNEDGKMPSIDIDEIVDKAHKELKKQND